MKKPRLDIGILFVLLLLVGCLLADDHKNKNSYVYIVMIVAALIATAATVSYMLLA